MLVVVSLQRIFRVFMKTVSMGGLLGVDMLKYLAPMKMSSFMNVVAFEFAQGFVPFGNIEDFLLARNSRVDPQIYDMNYSQVISLSLSLSLSLSILIALLPTYEDHKISF